MAKQTVLLLFVLAVGCLSAPADELQVPSIPSIPLSTQVSGSVNVKPALVPTPVDQLQAQDNNAQEDVQKVQQNQEEDLRPPPGALVAEVEGGNAPPDLLDSAAPPVDGTSDLEPAESWGWGGGWGHRHYGWGGRRWGGWGGYYKPYYGGWGRGFGYGGWGHGGWGYYG